MSRFVFPIEITDQTYSVHRDPRVTFIPNPVIILNPTNSADTVIFAHGNACTINDVVVLAEDFAEAFEKRVVLFEYPGYAGTRGTPSPEALTAAAVATVRYVRKTFGGDSRIYLASHSLGCGPSSQAARVERVDGLIMFAPFSSTRRVAEYNVGMLAGVVDWPDWDVGAGVAAMESKVLLVHGEKDDFIPLEESKILFARATRAEVRELSIDPEGTHVSIHTDALPDVLGTKPHGFWLHARLGMRLEFE